MGKLTASYIEFSYFLVCSDAAPGQPVRYCHRVRGRRCGAVYSGKCSRRDLEVCVFLRSYQFAPQTATHDFEPSGEDELALTEGDQIEVLEQPQGGWWRGQREREETVETSCG